MKDNIFKSSYEIDYNLIGIVSNLKEYKLAWVLNKIFSFDLQKVKNLKIKKQKRNFFEISNFLYQSDDYDIRLIKNKILRGTDIDEELYLIKNLSRFDYLFQIYDYRKKFNFNIIISKLNSESSIQFANFVDINFVKEKDLLLI